MPSKQPVSFPQEVSAVTFTPIDCGGVLFEYTLRHSSRRKTIQMKFLAPTRLAVTAPRGFSRDRLEMLLLKKSAWLLRSSQRLSALESSPVNQSITPGASLLYRGVSHRLHWSAGATAKIILTGDQLGLEYPRHWEQHPQFQLRVEKALRIWYIEQAGEWLLQRTRHWSAVIGVRPAQIRIKEQKSRWGSCSSLGNINYNWRLVMAPPAVVDYLVIHELCHLLEPNHSKRFWAIVRQHHPDCTLARQWLKQNGHLLSRLFS